MPTDRINTELDLGRSGARKLVGAFDGGAITSNGGVALLAGADGKLRLAERLAACFTDLRLADAIKHTLPDQREGRSQHQAVHQLTHLKYRRKSPPKALAISSPLASSMTGPFSR